MLVLDFRTLISEPGLLFQVAPFLKNNKNEKVLFNYLLFAYAVLQQLRRNRNGL